MRILEVLGSSAGGVVRHVASLTRELRADGDTVLVAGPATTLVAGGLAGEPVEIADRPRPLADLRAVARLRTLTSDVDAVHAHGLRAGAIAVLAARSRRRRPRIVVTLHNLPVGGVAVRLVTGVLERVVARGSDAVLVVSSDLGGRVRARGAQRVDRALVPSPQGPAPIGEQEVRAVREALEVGPRTTLLVCAARLAPQKDVRLLAEAMFLLAGAAPRTDPGGGEGGAGGEGDAGGAGGERAERRAMVAVVAGDGPLRAELEADARARDLPVRYLGVRDDVPRLFAAADLVVMTSAWEGQPLVAQEALRAGAALVATDVGGTRELVEDGAVLVPYDAADPETNSRLLADALARLIDHPEEAADLRRRARRRADQLPSEVDAATQIHQLLVTLRATGPVSQ